MRLPRSTRRFDPPRLAAALALARLHGGHAEAGPACQRLREARTALADDDLQRVRVEATLQDSCVTAPTP